MRDREGIYTPLQVGGENVGLSDLTGRLGANMYSSEAENVRASFTEYSNSQQGSVSFQNNIVNRGQLQ